MCRTRCELRPRLQRPTRARPPAATMCAVSDDERGEEGGEYEREEGGGEEVGDLEEGEEGGSSDDVQNPV